MEHKDVLQTLPRRQVGDVKPGFVRSRIPLGLPAPRSSRPPPRESAPSLRPAVPSSPARAGSSSKSVSSSGRTACASGSPKRQLYSITFGPFLRQHQAKIKTAGKTAVLPRSWSRIVGRKISSMHAFGRSPAYSTGWARARPCRRCFGPLSPSNARLWSSAETSGISVCPSVRASTLASSAREKFLNEHAAAALAEQRSSSIMARISLKRASSRRLGDDYALAQRGAVRLDDAGIRRFIQDIYRRLAALSNTS